MKPYSFKKRLLAMVLIALLAVMLPVFLYLDNFVRKSILDDTRAHVAERMQTTAWLMAQEAPFESYRALHEWLSRYAMHLGSRISVIIEGEVVADSSLTYSQLSRQGDFFENPEVVKALNGELAYEIRYSSMLRWEYLYGAMPLRNIPGLPSGVLRLSMPLTLFYNNISVIRIGMLGGIAGSVVLLAVLTLLLNYPMGRTIRGMTAASQAIGQGDFSRRISYVGNRELQPLAESINRMAHDIERHMIQLREQNMQFMVLFNGMHEGVALLDARGLIMSANPAFTQLFPHEGDLAGQSVLAMTGQDSLQQAVDTLVSNPHPKGTRLLLELPRQRIVEVSLVPFGVQAEQRLVLVFHDMSERVIVDRMRRDFVANISHELKTPLTSIKGYAEALQDVSPTADQEQIDSFLEVILRNTDHMAKLLNSLLDLARSEYANENLLAIPVNANESAHSALHDMLPVAGRKSIRLTHSLPEQPLWVLADRPGLDEVLRSLLDNAIKYSPYNTEVHIACRLPSEDQGADARVVLCVCDQGPGIPAEHKERVFERFFRLDREQPQPKNGSAGLGLAISRRIVKSFDGEIWVESPVNLRAQSGSAFCIALRPAPAPDVESIDGAGEITEGFRV